MSQQPKPLVALSKPDPYYGLPWCSVCHIFICMSQVHSNLFRFNTKLYISPPTLSTELHSSVTFAALVLLQHLKAYFTTAHRSSSHHLFLSTFMINQMEHVMCQYLNSELNVELGRVVVGRKCVDKELQ